MKRQTLNARLVREAEFFDQVYAQKVDYSDLILSENDKRRYVNPPANTIFPKEYYYHLLAPLRGKRILEIACGEGIDTCIAAYNEAEVYAYDISKAAIDLTRKRAEANNLSSRVHLQVCDELDHAFVGEQFDAIIGFAALHHLPLPKLGEKLHRRLQVGGFAMFAEPVVNSQVLVTLRNLIPYRPGEITEDEEPLNDHVIAEIAKPLDRICRREFECVARMYRLFPQRKKLVRAVFWLDRWLLAIKPLRRFASLVVFALYRDK